MKKVISILLLICMLMLGTAPVFAQSNESNPFTANPLCGDSDFDNTVTIKDASLIQKHVASLITLTEEQMQSSDVDGNGRVNIVDATWIQKKVAFICDKFPAETEPTEATKPDSTTEVTTETSLATDPTEAETSTAPATETTTTEATDPTEAETSTAPATETTTTEATDPTEVTTTVESTTEDEIEVTTTTVETTAQDPTEEPTETTTEIPTETSTETSTEIPTETTTEESTEPVTTEPATEDYKPVDTVEGDFITQEMLWTIEEGFLRLVNEERARLGLEPLSYKKGLDDGAQIRSKELITSYSHTRPDGTPCYSVIEDPAALHLLMIGENIYGVYGIGVENPYRFTGTEKELELIYTSYFTGFKNSPGHYANMIDKDFNYTGIGISYVYDKEYDAYLFYISHLFGQCY